jgi:maleate isomerase
MRESENMTDLYGYRLKIGVVSPSVNTVVQPEYDAMRPEGVTNHHSRIRVSNLQTVSDAGIHQSIADIDAGVADAVELVLTSEPDVILLGVSLEAIYEDPHAGEEIQDRLREKFAAPQLRLVHAGDAIPAALRAYGIEDGPIALLTPYGSTGEPQLTSFVKACGYDLAAIQHLRARSLVEIAHNTRDAMRAKVETLAASKPRAIVQFGANLPFAPLGHELEAELDLPIIPVNTATYWHTLRTSGIEDQSKGFGRLLAEH